MAWLLKNIGLVLLGLCILFGMASVEIRLESIENKLDATTILSTKLNQYAIDIPASALRALK